MRTAILITALLMAVGSLIWLWHTQQALRREREENLRLREILQVGNEMARGDLKKMQKLRHDLRHYLLLAGDTALPADTAAALRDALEADASIPGGESWAVSVLEQHYREQAQALGFQTDLHIVPPQGWENGIPDLCLVLSNLLENSIEALQREGGGWLRARSMSTAGYFSLVVGNTCTRPLRAFNGRYLSSKAPGRLGIGLETVREVAQRWGGQADFYVENGAFRASVFLPRPNAVPSGKAGPTEDAALVSPHS